MASSSLPSCRHVAGHEFMNLSGAKSGREVTDDPFVREPFCRKQLVSPSVSQLSLDLHSCESIIVETKRIEIA